MNNTITSEFLMQVRIFTYPFIILILILFLGCKISFAQDVPLILIRENLIFSTLNNIEKMQGLNRAIRETMQEAQIKLAEGKVVFKKERGSGFAKFASRTHFYLIQKATLNDNVDSSAQKKASLINEFTTGSKANFISRHRSLAIDMHIDNTFYNNRSRSNLQSAQADISYNFNIRRYTFSLSENYFNNYLAIKQFDVDDDNLENYWANTFKSTLGRSFNRVGFDMAYQRSDSYYEPAFSYNDLTTETITFNPYLRITKKTSALLEYAYGRNKYIHLTNPDDSHSNGLNLTLRSVLSPKLTGLTKIGYSSIDNKTSDDTQDTTLTANIGYAPSLRSNFTFMLKHIIHEEATDSGYYTENDFKLTGNHRLAFNPKLRISFSSEADYADYPKGGDSTNTYAFGLGLRYAFKQWLDLSLDWRHTRVATSYERNEAIFQAKAMF